MPVLVLFALTACRNECVDLCKQYDHWLDRCGYGWSTTFEDEGWSTIDDCYDDNWDADAGAQDQCVQDVQSTRDASCY